MYISCSSHGSLVSGIHIPTYIEFHWDSRCTSRWTSQGHNNIITCFIYSVNCEYNIDVEFFLWLAWACVVDEENNSVHTNAYTYIIWCHLISRIQVKQTGSNAYYRRVNIECDLEYIYNTEHVDRFASIT